MTFGKHLVYNKMKIDKIYQILPIFKANALPKDIKKFLLFFP